MPKKSKNKKKFCPALLPHRGSPSSPPEKVVVRCCECYHQARGSVEPAQVAMAHQYGPPYYVQVYRLPDRSTCRTPLRACYHHIRIFADWSESAVAADEDDGGITIRFQDVKRLKPKNHLLKVRMRTGAVYYVDFVHRTILKRFLDECVAQQFLKDSPYTIRSVEMLNKYFLKPVYYPNGQSRFYCD